MKYAIGREHDSFLYLFTTTATLFIILLYQTVKQRGAFAVER